MSDNFNEEPVPVSTLKRADLLLPYRIYNRGIIKKTFTDRLGLSVTKKNKIVEHNFKRLNTCLDLQNSIQTITNIDDEYYKGLNYRPLNKYTPIFKSFKTILNKRLRTEHDIGIKKDCILNIEVNYVDETEYYNKSLIRLTEQAKYFDSFILQDYQKSMSFLTKCEELSAKVERKNKELQQVAAELFNIKSKLVGLDYKYSIQQKYGRFLYYLSSPSWRANNREFAHSIEIKAKGFDLGNLTADDTFGVIFEKLCSICFRTPVKPVLYFKQPSDIVELFNAMEKQQLYYFTHVNHLEPHTNALKERIRLLKNKISQDSSLVNRLINRFRDLLKFTEKRCVGLENKFFRVLYGHFYKNVGQTDVLKLRVNLNFCYENVFCDKPTNMDIFSVFAALENCYWEYSKRLDAIKSDTVRQAILKNVRIERDKYKKAVCASNELRLFNRLQSRLIRAHGFLPQTTNIFAPKPSTESHHRVSKKNPIKKKNVLCSAELEYLTLFTEWCENEDPYVYLQDLNFV